MTTDRNKDEQGVGTSPGATLQFENIGEPGCYVCNWSGHLLRVPPEAVNEAKSPAISVIASQPLLVTKITNDPFTSLTKARMVASNMDVNVNF